MAGLRVVDPARADELMAAEGLGFSTSVLGSVRRLVYFVGVTLLVFALTLVPLLGALLLAGPLRLLCALGFALLLLVALVALWIYVPRVTLRGLQRLPLVGPRLAPLLGPCPYQGPRRSGRVAITFDDGPNGADTVAVLDALARHGARATFFCVGRAAAAQPETSPARARAAPGSLGPNPERGMPRF